MDAGENGDLHAAIEREDERAGEVRAEVDLSGFKWKDYRIKGRDRLKTMTLDAGEFIRRFLLHVLPSGFHRIRHYGLFGGTVRTDNIERARQALAASDDAPQRSRAEADSEAEDVPPARRCPCCGGRMIIVETFEGVHPKRSSSPSRIRIDTS
jgi:hypothetical protein